MIDRTATALVTVGFLHDGTEALQLLASVGKFFPIDGLTLSGKDYAELCVIQADIRRLIGSAANPVATPNK